MNVRDFKKKISTWDNIEENLKKFRIWAENTYELYQKNYVISYWETERQDISDKPFDETQLYKNLDYEWNYISYDDVVDLYNQLGLELDTYLKQIEASPDDGNCNFYYNISFCDVYKRIQSIDDNIEFCYAILLLIKSMDGHRKIHEEYASKISTGLRECHLEDSLKLLEHKEKVFIAMSFDKSMDGVRTSIQDTIRNFGYTPMLIDIKEHNNQIVPEIYKEIEDSAFVVADLTGQRGGVYYEAGYAVAKNKPLILCCNAEESGKVHFDLAQINTIFWKSEYDLEDRLKKRIKATIGLKDGIDNNIYFR